jgi:hypothetical protein
MLRAREVRRSRSPPQCALAPRLGQASRFPIPYRTLSHSPMCPRRVRRAMPLQAVQRNVHLTTLVASHDVADRQLVDHGGRDWQWAPPRDGQRRSHGYATRWRYQAYEQPSTQLERHEEPLRLTSPALSETRSVPGTPRPPVSQKQRGFVITATARLVSTSRARSSSRCPWA